MKEGPRTALLLVRHGDDPVRYELWVRSVGLMAVAWMLQGRVVVKAKCSQRELWLNLYRHALNRSVLESLWLDVSRGCLAGPARPDHDEGQMELEGPRSCPSPFDRGRHLLAIWPTAAVRELLAAGFFGTGPGPPMSCTADGRQIITRL